MVAPVTSMIENSVKIPTHAPTQTPSSSWFRPVSATEVMVSCDATQGRQLKVGVAKTAVCTQRWGVASEAARGCAAAAGRRRRRSAARLPARPPRGAWR